ncbi:hypothetical protein SDC9_67657 [bioreactor metagenome]|uniref:Uncharacterized protein n=1 Tax=bioreactor metagenome TaxID=1076179 RepID=A0A644Y4W8_9ZZZZ
MDPIQYAGFLLKQFYTPTDQVGKVDVADASKLSLIRLIHSLEGSIHLQAGEVVSRTESTVLGIRDFAHDRLELPLLVIRETGRKKGKRIIVIINGKI